MSIGASAGMAGLGALTSSIGLNISANAADKAKKAMMTIANQPGVDWRKYTSESVSGMSSMFPSATELGSKINAYYTSELEKALEQAYPGYAKQRGTWAGNVESMMSGEIPENLRSGISEAVMRSVAGKSLMGGYSGSPLASNMVARNLGREYLGLGLQLQNQGMGYFSQVPNIFPRAAQYDITQALGLTPQQLINLKSQERALGMSYAAQAAGMPGMGGTYGQGLMQIGSSMMGMGMGGLMSGGSSGAPAGGSGMGTSWPSSFGANNTWS